MVKRVGVFSLHLNIKIGLLLVLVSDSTTSVACLICAGFQDNMGTDGALLISYNNVSDKVHFQLQ